MVAPIPVDPKLGDAICQAIEKVHGVPVDIILLVTREGDWSKPSFISSIHPDIMEAVIMQIGEQMADSKGGKRTIIGKHTSHG